MRSGVLSVFPLVAKFVGTSTSRRYCPRITGRGSVRRRRWL